MARNIRLGLNLDLEKGSENLAQQVAKSVEIAGRTLKPLKVDIEATSPILKKGVVKLDTTEYQELLKKSSLKIDSESSKKAANELAGALSESIRKSVKDAQGGGLLSLIGSVVTAPLRAAGALSANIFRGAGESIGFGVAREIRSVLKKELDFDIYASGLGTFTAQLAAAPVNAFVKGNEQLGAVFIKIKNDLSTQLTQAAYRFGDALADSIDSDGATLQTFVQTISKDLSAEKFKSDFKQAAEYSKDIAAEIRDALASGARFQRIIDPLGEKLAQYREQAIKDRALPLVLQRAQEISESGKKTQKAGTYFDKERQKERDLFVKTGNVVDDDTKELIIATGGYAKAQGRSGLRIPGLLTNLPEGTKAIGALNRDTDIKAATSNIDRLFTLLGSLAKPNLRGYNKDAVEIAAQAIAALSKNPEIRIKILGESGGGYPAEEAKTILDMLGYGDRTSYLSVGTPDFAARLDRSSTRKILSSDELLGREAASVYRPLGLTADTKNQQLLGAREHPIENYLEFAELQNFIYGMPAPFTPEELAQAKEAAAQFNRISAEGKSNRELGTLTAQAFTTLQTVRRQFDLAEGDLLDDLQSVAASLESSFARLSEEPASFATTRQILAKAAIVLTQLRDQPGVEAQRVALVATEELRQLQTEFKGLAERKDPGTLGRKYKDLALEIEQTIDAFSIDNLIAQAKQAQQEAQAQAAKIQAVNPNEGLNAWDKAYDIWAENTAEIEASGKQAAKVFQSIKGTQLGLDLGEYGRSPAQQTAQGIMDLVISMVKTIDISSVNVLNIKGIKGQGQPDTSRPPEFTPQQLSLDFGAITGGIEEHFYSVDAELVQARSNLEKVFDLVGLGNKFREATNAVTNTVDAIAQVERDFLAIVPLGREAKAELQTLLSKLGMFGKSAAITGAASAVGGAAGLVQGVENAAFTALPFLKPAKGAIQGVGVPLALAAGATQLPGVGGAVGGAIELAGSVGAGGASAIATAVIDMIGQGVLSTLPPELARAVLTQLPNIIPGLGGQSISAIAGGALEAAALPAAQGIGTLTAEAITAIATGNIIVQAGKGAIQMVPGVLQAKEFLSLPAAQSAREATGQATQRALQSAGSAAAPAVRAQLQPAQRGTAEVSQSPQIKGAEQLALGAGATFQEAIARGKYLEEQFRTLQQSLFKVTQAMRGSPGDLDLLLKATAQASQLTKQSDAAQKEIQQLRDTLKATGAIDGQQSQQISGYVGAIGQRAAEGRKFLAALTGQYEQSGRDIGQFISAGIAAGMDPESARASAQAIVRILIDTTETGLEIRSPSRVFRRIGQFISEGLSLGIRDGKNEVKAAASDLGDSAVDAVKQTTPGSIFKTIVAGAGQAKQVLGDLAVKAGLPVEAIGKLGGIIKGVGIAALAYVGITQLGDALVELGRQAFDVSTRMEVLQTQLKFVGGESNLPENLAFIREESERLQRPLSQITEGFTKLTTATQGTALEGRTQEIQSAIGTLGRVYSLSNENLTSLQYQLGQTIRLGRLQGDELRSFSDAGIQLQGVLEKVTGKSGSDFTKMLESGSISATMVVDALKALSETAKAGLPAALQTTQAAIDGLQAKFEKVAISAGVKLQPAVVDALKAIGTGIDLAVVAAQKVEPIFNAIGEALGLVLDVATPIVGAIAAIGGAIANDLVQGAAIPFQIIGAGLSEIRKGFDALETAASQALGAIASSLPDGMGEILKQVNPVTLAIRALGIAIGINLVASIVQSSIAIVGTMIPALIGLATTVLTTVIPAIASARIAALAFIATPLGATITAIGIAAALAAPHVEELALAVSGLSKEQVTANDNAIAFNTQYAKGLNDLQKGIPLTADKLKELKDGLIQNAKEGKGTAKEAEILSANLDRLQANAQAAAKIQGELAEAMKKSTEAIKNQSKAIDSAYNERLAGLNESLANQQITRERFDAAELDAQQEKTTKYVELYQTQGDALRSALSRAQAQLLQPIPDAARAEVVKQVVELEGQINDIETKSSEQRIALAQNRVKRLENIEKDRTKRAENEVKALENQLAAGTTAQIEIEQRISELKQKETKRRIEAINRQLATEVSANGKLSEIAKNLYSERAVLETELTKIVSEQATKRYEILLKDLEKTRDKLAGTITEAEVESNIELQKAQNAGLLKQAQVESKKTDITRDRLRKELALELANIETLQSLPSPTDPEKAEEHQKRIREGKLKTAQLTQQIAENEYKRQTEIRQMAEKAIEEQVKGVENAVNAVEQLGKISTNALERQNKILEAQKNLRASIVGLHDEEFRILIETETNERDKADLQEKAAKFRLDSLRASQELEEKILEIQLAQEKVQNRVAILKAQAAVAKAEAEKAKVDANPESTDADKQAAALGLEASQIELGATVETARLQEGLAQFKRQQVQVDNRKELLGARFDYAKSIVDPMDRREAIERVQASAARGLRERTQDTPRFVLPTPVNLHAGLGAQGLQLTGLSDELKQLRMLTQNGVAANLVALVSATERTNTYLSTMAGRRPVTIQRNNTTINNSAGRSNGGIPL